VFSTRSTGFRERSLLSNAFKRAVFEGEFRVILDKREREKPADDLLKFFFFFAVLLLLL